MRLFAIALTLIAACELHAATVLTVNWAASTDNGFGLANGTPLAVGNEIRVGSFDFPDGTLNAQIQGFIAAGDLAGLATHFTSFDTAFIGISAFPGNLGMVPIGERGGLFEDSSGGVAVSAGSPIFSKQIFLWAFKTTGDNAVLGNFSNVTQTGIFSNNTAAWFFPGDTNSPETRSIELTNLSNGGGTALAGTERIVAGGFATSTVPLATTSNHVFTLITVVPEPGTVTLLAVGCLAFAARRRRV